MTSSANASNLMGHAHLEPSGDVVAGSYGTWRLRYTTGAQGVAASGRIRIFTDSDTDWADPQVKDPAAADYLSVETPPGVGVNIVVQRAGNLLLQLRGRALEPGEVVIITYGDQSGGGPGSRAQTFAEQRRYFYVAVDKLGNGAFETIPDAPVCYHRR